MLQAGGLAVNKLKMGMEKNTLTASDLLQNKYVLLQKGKKNYYLVIVG